MANAAQASLTFLPWVRQGAASLITTPDTLGANQPGVVNLSAVLSINATAIPSIPVRLRGPADVVGIDANQIIRREPQPGVRGAQREVDVVAVEAVAGPRVPADG